MRAINSFNTLEGKTDHLSATKDPRFKGIGFTANRIDDLPAAGLHSGMISIMSLPFFFKEPLGTTMHCKAKLIASLQDLSLHDVVV